MIPNLRQRAFSFIRGGLFKNIVSLYGVQASHQALQLLTIPFLARMLGPSEWGSLAEAQSVAAFIIVIVNYGFPLAATREVARWRDDPQRLSVIVSDVLGAQVILGLFTAGAALLFCSIWLPDLFAHTRMMLAAIVYGVISGSMPMWFFQGQERMGRVASLDMTGKIFTAVGLFIVIRSPDDGWRMLAMQATSSLVVFTIAWREIFRLHLIERPSPARLFTTFKQGWDMFMFAGASSALGLGNVLLLSLFAPTTLVGYYAGAEKLCRGFVGALWPLNQAIFPRINHLCHTDPPAGARLLLRSLAIMGCGGLLVFIAAMSLAPEVIRLVLGPGFEPAIPVLRMMSPIILTMPLNIVFGLQWSVPMGLDRAYSRIILLAVVFNVAVAFLLAPRFFHLGMAATVALTEGFVLGGVLLMLKKNKLSPFRIAQRDRAGGPLPQVVASEG